MEQDPVQEMMSWEDWQQLLAIDTPLKQQHRPIYHSAVVPTSTPQPVERIHPAYLDSTPDGQDQDQDRPTGYPSPAVAACFVPETGVAPAEEVGPHAAHGNPDAWTGSVGFTQRYARDQMNYRGKSPTAVAESYHPEPLEPLFAQDQHVASLPTPPREAEWQPPTSSQYQDLRAPLTLPPMWSGYQLGQPPMFPPRRRMSQALQVRFKHHHAHDRWQGGF